MKNHKEAGYALLRITFGGVFLVFGLGKFGAGIGGFVGSMVQSFSGKLPSFLVVPFAYTLPFAEVILGVLIIVGLFSEYAFVLSGLLLIALTFGTILLSDTVTVAHNVQYGLVNFVLLWFAEYNGFSADRFRNGPPVKQS